MLERLARSRGPGSWYRRSQSLRFALTRDRGEIGRFMLGSGSLAELRRRAGLLWAYERVTHGVRGYHALAEILRISRAILARPGAVVVEAGAAKGSSTAKLSLAVREVGGELHVFDTFRGIPANDEVHTNLEGRTVRFREGAFRGRLRSVERTVERYGAIEVCTFHKGLFADTLPRFRAPIDVAVFDVDLLSSTATCARYLLPQLTAGGVAFSQDGHLRAIVDLLGDRDFWARDVGVEPPHIEGLGVAKFLELSWRETC